MGDVSNNPSLLNGCYMAFSLQSDGSMYRGQIGVGGKGNWGIQAKKKGMKRG